MPTNANAQPDSPPPPTSGGLNVINFLLSLIPSLALAGTAFLFLAGRTYLDSYLRGFGILFGATEATMPDVISLGYTAVFYTLVIKAPFYLKMIAWEMAGALAVVLVVVAGVKWKVRFFVRTHDIIDGFNDMPQRIMRHVLLLCIVVLVLLGAQPAGNFAANSERRHTLQKVKEGCCFVYSSSGRSVQGYPIAQDHNHIWLLATDGLTALPLENLTVRSPKKPDTKRKNFK